MNSPKREKRAIRGATRLMLGAVLALCAGTRDGTADVTITARITFDGVGERHWGAREGTSVFVVTADKARRENDTSPTGPSARAGARKAAVITRLDRSEIIHVDYVAKNYYALSFEEMKKNLSDAVASLGEGGERQGEEAKSDRKVKWQPPKFDVKRTGAQDTIHEFPCEETSIIATTDGENVETGQTCTLRLTVDVWSTPRMAALEDLAAFRRRQVEALGADMDQMDSIGALRGGLDAPESEGLSDVAAQVDKVAGYPIRTRFTVEKAGDCGAARTGPLAGRMIARREARRRAFAGSDSSEGFKKVLGLTKEVVSIVPGPAPAGAFDPPGDFTKTDPPKRSARTRTPPQRGLPGSPSRARSGEGGVVDPLAKNSPRGHASRRGPSGRQTRSTARRKEAGSMAGNR